MFELWKAAYTDCINFADQQSWFSFYSSRNNQSSEQRRKLTGRSQKSLSSKNDESAARTLEPGSHP